MSDSADVNLVMPQMGESLTEGTVARWLKQVGDRIVLDEPVVEISTDKVDTEIPAPTTGVLAAILVQQGATVTVGSTLAVITVPSGPSAHESAAHFASGHAPQLVSFQRGSNQIATAAAATLQRSLPASSLTNRSCSPAVLDAAARGELSAQALLSLQGTGRGGRVTKRDVQRIVAAQKAVPPVAQGVEVTPGRGGARLLGYVDVDLTRLLALQTFRHSEADKASRFRLVAAICAAAVRTMREVPFLNSSVGGRQRAAATSPRVAVAVPMDGNILRIRPIVRAEGLNLSGFVRDLSEAAGPEAGEDATGARDGSLVVVDLADAPGVIGDAAVGDVANLTIGAVRQQAVAVRDGIAIRRVLTLTLAVDSRATTGSIAFRFLSRVRDLLEEPPADWV